MSTDTTTDMRRALAAGMTGYLIWGISPLYFQTLGFASAVEIILHRVIWAVPLLMASLALSGKLRAALGVLADRRTLLTLLATSVLISINWWGFVFAVNTGHVLQASLGYYINPLMSVAVGVIILREPLGPWRIAAITLAALGVANQIITVGQVPWISLMLATTFTAYGYLRKVAAVDGRVGLLWETLFILPFAIVGLGWLQASGGGHFFETPLQAGLLMASGLITVVPLLLYTIGVRGLRLSTMGLLQFTAPSIQFAIGIMSGETFETGHMITFALIWSGVGCFAWSQMRRDRKLAAVEDAG